MCFLGKYTILCLILRLMLLLDRGSSMMLTPGGQGPQSVDNEGRVLWADRLCGATVAALWIKAPYPGKNLIYSYLIPHIL